MGLLSIQWILFDTNSIFSADHAGCTDTRKKKKHFGGIQILGDKTLEAGCLRKNQKLHALSSAEDGSVVRLGIQSPIDHPEPARDSTKDKPKLEIAVLRSNGGNGNLNPIQCSIYERHTNLECSSLKDIKDFRKL
ncbi:hypothetical protein Tco_1327895 [Tanacetum coccineum]